jgi:DNA repair protein SbcC/Rad50
VILRRLRVHPFGFFADRDLRFSPGLNVVLGPNEAGKSTLFGAVKSSFLKTRLTRPQFQQYIARYVPVTGGDVVRVELEFDAAGGTWILRRCWGPSPASELMLPGGGSLMDEEAITAKLESILPAKQGTVWKILMTGQSELLATLATLKKDAADALSDLADILRKAVLEAGGVSVDRFLAKLAERRKSAFSHWDAARDGPEKGRGIENPWKNEVGAILESWYAAQRIAADRKAALSWEKELDDINGRISAAAAAAAASEMFVADNKKAAADAGERRRWEADLRVIRLELAEWKKASREWPRVEDRMRELQESISQREAAAAALERERSEAEREEQGRALREKTERVGRCVHRVTDAKSRLVEAPPMEKKTLEEIRLAAQKLGSLEAGVAAGRLSVAVAGRAEVRIAIQEDFSPESSRTIRPGEVLHLTAGGRLRIVHPEMEIEVRSGEAGFEEKMNTTEAARRALEELLSHQGVSGLPEAEERAAAYARLAAERDGAEKQLAEELAGETLAGLEARVGALGPSRLVRPLAVVAAELADVKARLEGMRRDLDELRRQAGEWQTAYGTPDAVLERLAGGVSREREIAETLSRSAPLPQGFTDAESFLRTYDAAQEEAKRRGEEKTRLLMAKPGLEARAPKESAEDLAVRLKEGEAELQGQMRRGQALLRITETAESLLGASDAEVSAGMRAPVEEIVAAITGGRHLSVEMAGTLPSALSDPKGGSLSWELLSAGTRDALALAVRLAMAFHFLKGSDGFLMMDDPLVDMDPVRQKAAAAAIAAFASDKQLILFTCHPSTADLFTGNLIRL